MLALATQLNEPPLETDFTWCLTSIPSQLTLVCGVYFSSARSYLLLNFELCRRGTK